MHSPAACCNSSAVPRHNLDLFTRCRRQRAGGGGDSCILMGATCWMKVPSASGHPLIYFTCTYSLLLIIAGTFGGTYCLPTGQGPAQCSIYVSLYCLLQPAVLYLSGRKCIGNRQVAEDASGPGASPCPSLPVPGSVYLPPQNSVPGTLYLPPHKSGQLFPTVLDNSAAGCPYHLQEAQFCNGPFGSFHGLSILTNCFRYLKLLLFLLFTASPPPSFSATCLASTVYCLCQSANQHLQVLSSNRWSYGHPATVFEKLLETIRMDDCHDCFVYIFIF